MISFHSNWALAVLALLIVAIANSILKLLLKKEFNIIDKKIALYAMIATHIQLILGVWSFFVSQRTNAAMSNMGAAMKDSTLRLVTVEHPMMMLIGIALITIGFVKSKKAQNDAGKFKSIAIFYILGFVLILARIPWTLWGSGH